MKMQKMQNSVASLDRIYEDNESPLGFFVVELLRNDHFGVVHSKLSAFLIVFIQADSYWLVYIIRSLKLDSCDRGASSTESFGRKNFGFTA
jgi:hypothetical protein